MNRPPIHDHEIFATLADMVARGVSGVLATVIEANRSTPRQMGSKMIIHADGTITGSVGGGAAEARVLEEARLVLADGSCRRLELDLVKEQGVCGGQMEVFLEPISRDHPFIIIGAGHLGRAMVELGRSLPFRFTLVDDRPEFLMGYEGTPVTTIEAGPEDLGAKLEWVPGAAVLLASRSHDLDRAYLHEVLALERSRSRCLPFVGLVGSRAKIARIRADLLDICPECESRLDEVRMPVGLDLGDEAPAEIALSILAEAMAVLRGVEPLRGDDDRELGFRLRRRRGDGKGTV